MISKWQILKGSLISKVACKKKKKNLLYFWNRFLEILVRQSTISTVSLLGIDYLGKNPVFIELEKLMIAEITENKIVKKGMEKPSKQKHRQFSI